MMLNQTQDNPSKSSPIFCMSYMSYSPSIIIVDGLFGTGNDELEVRS